MINKFLESLKENYFYFIIAFFLMLCDIVSKYIIQNNIFSSYYVNNDTFKIVLYHNSAELNVSFFYHPVFLISFICLIDIFLILFMKSKILKYTAVFAFAGLVNIYEKIIFGQVVDFLYFSPFNSIFRFISKQENSYLIFNLADMFILTSVFLYFIYLMRVLVFSMFVLLNPFMFITPSKNKGRKKIKT